MSKKEKIIYQENYKRGAVANPLEIAERLKRDGAVVEIHSHGNTADGTQVVKLTLRYKKDD